MLADDLKLSARGIESCRTEFEGVHTTVPRPLGFPSHCLEAGKVGGRYRSRPIEEVVSATFSLGCPVRECVEFAEPFCPVLRSWLIDAGKKLDDIKIHDGATYVCMEGPAFSTRAESEMHRAWGADLIGMTLLPEARLAHEAELAYAHIALPTDYDCWRPREDGQPQTLLKEIIGNLQQATENSIQLIKTALGDISALEKTPSPAHEALALAIWSDKAAIPREEIDRLHVLWGRHFS